MLESRGLVVEAGGQAWSISDDYLEHEETGPDSPVAWSEVERLGGEGRARLEALLAEQAAIPWSRVVLDLHSGTLFGKVGRLLVDVSGVAIIVLTLLGGRLLFRKSAMRS